MATPVVEVTVRVTPRADRNTVAGVRDDGVLLVRVHAAPADGAANAAVVAVVAEALGVRKSAVTLVAGHTAREKRLAVEGLTPETLAQRVRSLAGSQAKP